MIAEGALVPRARTSLRASQRPTTPFSRSIWWLSSQVRGAWVFDRCQWCMKTKSVCGLAPDLVCRVAKPCFLVGVGTQVLGGSGRASYHADHIEFGPTSVPCIFPRGEAHTQIRVLGPGDMLMGDGSRCGGQSGTKSDHEAGY